MPFLMTMPKLSPTMESGIVTKWHKKIGDLVQPGDVLMEVATDKATVEHQAIDEGYLRLILVEEGKEAQINEAIAVFTETKDENLDNFKVPEKPKKQVESEPPAVTELHSPEAPAPTVKKASTSSLMGPTFKPEAPLKNYQFEKPRSELSRISASPLAKKLAKERMLDLTTVKGSGPNDRIMARDLDQAMPNALTTFSRREIPTLAPGSYREIPMTPMRKIVGKRLQESKTFIPHFYVNVEVDAERLCSTHLQLKEAGIKVSYNDFVVRACALALRKFPNVNSGYNSETESMVLYQTIDISIAVSVDGGLITPIVRHADYKNLGELAVEVKALAKKARTNKLTLEEYKGGSFTISNLGMYGIDSFQAIINPPQSAILAVGGLLDKPIVKNGAVVPGKVMTLVLSCDHRIVDGVAAAEFIKFVKQLLESPAQLLL
ncbi:MAG: pyruvate dehydrogenase complex dihydrolipoamide acetyltransferase [Parachlamydiales bacterium]|nr:pyruvate dehydrogenase complex dihydrolipoamide acetyltransferase [Parachlamydiales bacterium]